MFGCLCSPCSLIAPVCFCEEDLQQLDIWNPTYHLKHRPLVKFHNTKALQFVWVKRTSICDQLHAIPNTMKPSRCTQSSLWAFQRDQECRSEASQFGGSHLYKQNKTNKLPSFIDSYCLHSFATKPIMRNQTTHSSIFKVRLNYGHYCPTFDVVDCSFTPLAF